AIVLWDVVILDLNMPGQSGLDALKKLKEIRPAVPVLILTVHPEDECAAEALWAGAAGYINKKSVAQELVGAVRKVLAGGTYVSAALAVKLARTMFTDYNRPLHEALSARELQVLRLI